MNTSEEALNLVWIPSLLSLHNIIRWLALILGLIVTVVSIYGWASKRTWTRSNRMLGVFYTSALDIQLLLGLLMYFVTSDLTRAAVQNLAEAIGNPQLRFFAMEHVFYMLLAVVFAHLGNIYTKKAPDDMGKLK